MPKWLVNLWFRLRYGETPPKDPLMRHIYIALKKKHPCSVHRLQHLEGMPIKDFLALLVPPGTRVETSEEHLKRIEEEHARRNQT